MFEAAKFGDPVLGVDIHMVLVPAPPAPAPVPTPLPHPFIGVVFDPIGAAIGAAIGAVFGGGGPVFINAMPVGNTGTDAKGIPHLHTPPGVSFAPNDIPDNAGTITTGSKTVSMAGASCGRLTSMVMTCNFPINLPTSLCMAVPMGGPVLVGGPDSFDILAAVTRGIRTKWFSDFLHRVTKAGPRLSRVICFLTGHPVDVVTGEVLADAVDFELPGPIPLKFERNYYSRDTGEGPLGPGWHHPLDASADERADEVRVRLPDGRERTHDPLPPGGSLWDDIDRYTLARTERGYQLTFWDGLRLHFEPVRGAPATHPLVRITDRCENAVELRYEGGRLCEVVDSVGRVLELAVSEGRLRSIRMRWRGERIDLVSYAYDGEGRLAAAFDPKGRPVAVRLPDGSTLQLAYDGEGNLVERTDELGNTTRFRYGGFNKLVERIDPAGGILRYTYDTEENLVGVTNELGEEYSIEVDLAGRVVREQGFDGRTLEFHYDRAGRCVETVNGQKKRTKIERDPLGRATKLVIPKNPVMGDPIPKGEEVEYAYDALGRLILARNGDAEVSFIRDALGRIVEERADGRTISSRYDATNNRVGRRTSLGHETTYDFDGNGELLGLVFGRDPRWKDFTPESLAKGGPVRAPWQATLRRDAAGHEVERALPGAVVSTWQRDTSGRPRVHRTARDGEPVMGVGYQWRSTDQIAGLIHVHAGPTWFEHDARSYLVAARRPDGSVQYRAPDAVGNVYRSPDRRDRTYGRGGRLESADGVRYVHDEDGQLVEKVMPDGARWRYAWDHAGQLREVVRPDGQRVTFAYDALGRRVRKTFAGRTTTYVWDGNDLVHEVTEGEPLVTWEFEPGTFAPIAKVEGDRRYGVVTDHLGTPVALFDDGGEIAWRAELDLYGVPREEEVRTGCPWRWPGQYEDEETGLYYNRFRYYDPESGKYVSQDPIGLIGGINIYGYVVDPLRWIDPDGLASCDKVTRQTRRLTQDELNHAFDRHAAELFGREVSRARDFDRFAALVDSARRSDLTFFWRSGGSETIGHLARVDGEYVVVQFFRNGPEIGNLATVFRPSQRQLGRIFDLMSRNGP